MHRNTTSQLSIVSDMVFLYFTEILPFDHIFGMPDSGEWVFEESLIVPVEIPSGQRTPVVTHYHTIWV